MKIYAIEKTLETSLHEKKDRLSIPYRITENGLSYARETGVLQE